MAFPGRIFGGIGGNLLNKGQQKREPAMDKAVEKKPAEAPREIEAEKEVAASGQGQMSVRRPSLPSGASRAVPAFQKYLSQRKVSSR